MNYIEMASEHVGELYPLIIYHQPRLMDLPPGAILGTWAYSVPGKMRYILARDLELSPGVLPGDLARAWIRDQYKLPIRRRKGQLARGYPVPNCAKRGFYPDCSYIDIKGAYLSILRVGFDVEYYRGHYFGADPRSVPEEVRRSKLCYSVAVTMSGSGFSNLEVMGKEGVFNHRPLNLFSNPSLYNLANDTLNAIGAEILAVLPDHCYYANTDGYIIEHGYEQYAQAIITSWGFRSAVRIEEGIPLQGKTEIRGVASFRIGEYQTKRFDHNATDFCGPLMDRDDRKWLKTRWVKWSQYLPEV